MKKVEIRPEAWQAARGYRKNRLLTAEELASPGTLVQLVEIEPGDRIPDHVHRQSREFYYVLAGTCLLTISGVKIRLRPGTMLLTEPGDVHQLVNDGGERFRLLVFKTNAAPDDTRWPG
jgi:quercetin dioxygenase-like cupin family protein